MRGPAAARLSDIVITANCDNSRSLRKLATILYRFYALNERNRMLSPDKISRKLGVSSIARRFCGFYLHVLWSEKSSKDMSKSEYKYVFILPKITNFIANIRGWCLK